MKGWMKTMAAALALAVAGGCASTVPGRFTGVEWDSRSPEQLAAAVQTDTAVYDTPAAEQEQARAFTEWKALFDMISGLRVKIRLACVEWGSDKRTK